MALFSQIAVYVDRPWSRRRIAGRMKRETASQLRCDAFELVGVVALYQWSPLVSVLDIRLECDGFYFLGVQVHPVKTRL